MTHREVEFEGVRATTLRGRAFPSSQPRGRVLIVHGLGEHQGRYDEVVTSLTARGLSVFSYDHRGHGRSDGPRGHADAVDDLVADLEEACRQADRHLGADAPMILLGHSMGGMLVLRYLDGHPSGVEAAVVSAPWLRTANPPGPWIRRIGSALERLVPSLGLPGSARPELLTRDPERIRAYRDDRHIHQRVSPRLYFSVERAQERILARSAGYGLPVLMIVPEDDGLADPAPALAFAARLEAEGVELARLPGVRHEPFNDLGREQVLRRVGDWIDARVH